MKNLTILLLSMTLFGCGQSSEDKHIDNQLVTKQTNLDSGFTVISTTKFIRACLKIKLEKFVRSGSVKKQFKKLIVSCLCRLFFVTCW